MNSVPSSHSDASARPAGPARARVLIRPSRAADIPAIVAIYAWHVTHGSGSFELEPPGAAEIGTRRDAVLAHALPWLVAERGGEVLGYAYADWFRARGAYRYCAEDAVYVAPDARGQGLGRLLLAELLARAEAAGVRQMVALVGDAANAASIALHRSAGFQDAGVLHAAGWKHERWLDVVLLQKRLGWGSDAPATAAGVLP